MKYLIVIYLITLEILENLPLTILPEGVVLAAQTKNLIQTFIWYSMCA